MSEEQKLLPCPFCGSSAARWCPGGEPYNTIACDNDACFALIEDHETWSEAVAAWNRRASTERTSAAERDLAEALALLRRVRDCTALVHVCLDAEIEDFLDALLQRHGSVDVRKTPGGAEAETKGKEKTEVKP